MMSDECETINAKRKHVASTRAPFRSRFIVHHSSLIVIRWAPVSRILCVSPTRWSFLCRDDCSPRDRAGFPKRLQPTRTLGGPRQCVLLGLAPGGGCQAAASPRRRCALTLRTEVPHLFTLTAPKSGGLFSVALFRPRGFLRTKVAVSDRLALWCPDFPR